MLLHISMNGNIAMKHIGYFRNTKLKIYIFVTAFYLFLSFLQYIWFGYYSVFNSLIYALQYFKNLRTKRISFSHKTISYNKFCSSSFPPHSYNLPSLTSGNFLFFLLLSKTRKTNQQKAENQNVQTKKQKEKKPKKKINGTKDTQAKQNKTKSTHNAQTPMEEFALCWPTVFFLASSTTASFQNLSAFSSAETPEPWGRCLRKTFHLWLSDL